MKFLLVTLFIAAAAANSADEKAELLRSDYQQSPEGNFQYAYETSNGILGQASGQIQPINKDEIAQRVSGSYQYKSPEGEEYSVRYVADENGYQPQGAHLPTPPAPEPIPEYIARAIAYIKEHPYVEKKL